MKKADNIQSSIAVIALIAFATLTRFLPHPANFTAIGAIALFGSARFKNPLIGLSLPLLSMLISDAFMPFGYNLYVYIAFLSIGLLGLSLRNTEKKRYIAMGSVAASTIFFLISNFSVWMIDGLYTKDIQGLVLCYTAAIPFYWNTLAGDLFFNTILFGAYALYTQKVLRASIIK